MKNIKLNSYYDLVFVTNQPSFYKVKLYNEISKRKRILVLFTYHLNSNRNKDFISEDCNFENYNLIGKYSITKSRNLLNILNKISYRELILSGWDNLPTWIAAFFKNKGRNSCVSESSYHESTTRGFKGFLKRIFISRISRVYVCGQAQKKVLENLGFKGKYYITKGVGVFNVVQQPKYEARKEVKNFLYVGRFIPVKNLIFLINFFNLHPDLNLYLVGFGELEEKLKQLANKNIYFCGSIPNKDLPQIYQKMDVFILPSKSEAWGLVVEEALNNGLPVIVSNKVGCAEEIVNERNGLIFNWDSITSLDEAISKIRDIKFYNQLRLNISKMDFKQIEMEQISQYIH